MNKNKLSLQTRKCLRIQLGDRAGNEIYNLINGMNEEIDNLRRNKTDAAMTSLRKGWDQASKMQFSDSPPDVDSDAEPVSSDPDDSPR